MDQKVSIPLHMTLADRVLRAILGSILLAGGVVLLAMPFFLVSPAPGEEARPNGLLSALLVAAIMSLLTVYSLSLGISFLRGVFARPRIECIGDHLVVTHPLLFRSSLRVPLGYVWAIRSRERPKDDWFILDDQLILDGAQHILELEPTMEIEARDVHEFLNVTAEITLPSLSSYPAEKNNLMVLFDRECELPPRRGWGSAGGYFDWAKAPRSREAVRGFIIRVRRAAKARRAIEGKLPEESRSLRLTMLAPSERDVGRVILKKHLALVWLVLFLVSGIGHILSALLN